MTRRTLELIGCAATAVLSFTLYTTVLVIAPIWVMSAYAQDGYRCHYVTRSRPALDTWSGQVVTQYYQVRQCYRNHAYYLPEAHPRTRVYGYERRRDRDRDRDDEYGGHVECKGHPLRVTGDDKLQENNAEVSAQERWALEVENRYGTLYSDVRYAKQMRITCIRKVPASVTERGQAALGVRHHICTVTAIACAAPAVRVDDDTRAKRRSERIDDERVVPAPARRDR